VILNNISRMRVLTIPSGRPRPESILAMPLRHENQYYGVLWLAYDDFHQFTEDEKRFIATLSGQAALAAANARLFQSAELGRERLAAILASSPDPVLVTDHQNRLLLSNPAAWEVLGFGAERTTGQAIERVTTQKELLKLLRSAGEDRQSAEITLLNGKIYLATATSVVTEGQRKGRVCVLRDITHFKELDQVKSEFVQTVSHDLRAPLTLIRGYTSMLEMVGDLNDQQANYVRKILISVESMNRLVTTLLDLGRIEAGIDLQLEMILVHDVVERVVGGLQLTAAQKRIILTSEVSPETVPLIEADQALLSQALQNLVDNGIKYTENGGKVHVRVFSKVRRPPEPGSGWRLSNRSPSGTRAVWRWKARWGRGAALLSRSRCARRKASPPPKPCAGFLRNGVWAKNGLCVAQPRTAHFSPASHPRF
jgi:PAS domain S-box-containing protein